MSAIDAFRLLPTVHQMEDEQRQGVLEALVAAVSVQMGEVHDNIEDLWDDFFVETCADWVVPYIGDLVANNALHGVGQRARADVFKTIRYRRRKGTLPTLEEVVRDVTRWGACVVPFFESLEWTQNVNHLRMVAAEGRLERGPDWLNPAATARNGTAHLRNNDMMGLVGGAFDGTSRSVDVRRIGQHRGWFNIRNVGVFVWRLRDYAMVGLPAHPVPGEPGRFHVSPLGQSMPLFNPEHELSDRERADERAVPAPIRPAALHFRPSAYYGHGNAVAVYVGGVDEAHLVPLENVVVKDLSTWAPPSAGRVAIDAHLGRLVFADPPTEPVWVAYSYGFSADIGGGPYDRRRLPDGRTSVRGTVARPSSRDRLIRVPGDEATIAAAIASWDPIAHPSAVIQVEDSRTYAENLHVDVGAGRLVLQAQNGERPLVEGDIDVEGDPDDGAFELDGVLVSGSVVIGSALRELLVTHCTLVPGVGLHDDSSPRRPDRPSILVDPANTDTRIVIVASILGPLQAPPEIPELVIRDSIVDSPAGTGPTANHVPVQVSARNAAFSGLTSPTPRIQVASNTLGPFTVSIKGSPTTLGDLALSLQAAIRASHSDPSFARARVLGVPGTRRLVVVPGTARGIRVTSTDGDSTASEAGFDVAGSYATNALVGTSVDWSAVDNPVGLSVTVAGEAPIEVSFESGATSLATFRSEVQAAIRASSDSLVLHRVLVARDVDRLIVVPGVAHAALVLAGTAADPTTVAEIGLAATPPAIAAGPFEDGFGPPTQLERTTILGAVRVRTLSASNVLFNDVALAERRQSGCVRFSFVADGSRLPRRYRCQPDLALEGVPNEEREVTLARLRPAFTSTHYGQPAYAQLSRTCPIELRTGADDGSEMGVFSHLRQPQREANLRIRVAEYLPFGLNSGVVFVT